MVGVVGSSPIEPTNEKNIGGNLNRFPPIVLLHVKLSHPVSHSLIARAYMLFAVLFAVNTRLMALARHRLLL